MGQGESQPSGSSPRPLSANGGAAFHVLRVAEQSPAAEAGIEPFFDFICGINGRPLGDEIDALTQVLEESEGRNIVLQVWSTKRKELRDVDITPNRSWSSSSAPSQSGGQPSLLGLSLRVCSPHAALDQVWHVLEILEGSPAQSAGLVPFGDWIVGYAGGVLRGEGDFYDVVEAHVDKPLRLFVYNADYDVTREAILVPNRSWGGEGLLGCGVGYGLLHRIPKPQDRPPQHLHDYSPPEPAEEAEDENDGRFLSTDHGAEDEDEPQALHHYEGMQSKRGTYGHNDGFTSISYADHRFDASEGVEVVPVSTDAEDHASNGRQPQVHHQGYGFVPVEAYTPKVAPRESMLVSSARNYDNPYTPRMSFGGEPIREEGDDESLT